jgi:hypothetical protein
VIRITLLTYRKKNGMIIVGHEFDNAIHLFLFGIGLLVLAFVLSIVVIPLQIAAWLTGLPIPDSIKLVLLDHIFAFTITLIGIPAIIVGRITKIL